MKSVNPTNSQETTDSAIEGTFVIAEIGVNHDGSADRAKQLVRIAKHCGADAVKLQVFSADRLMNKAATFAEYQQATVGDADPSAMLRRYELDEASLRGVVELIHAAGMTSVATPFSPADVETIARIGAQVVKIASPDLVNCVLLERAASLKKPMIVSTGAATIDEVRTTCRWLRSWSAEFSLLHCVSSYPTPAEMSHLCWIGELKRAFNVSVGYSDHGTEIATGALAAASGATIVERHLTYDRRAEGPDHAASSDPLQFSQYVGLIRLADRMRGTPGKRVLSIEQDVRQVSRQSLVSRRDLRPGSVISSDDVTVQRPGTGIPAAMIESMLGRTVRTPIAAGELLQWDMVSEAA